MFNSIFIEIGAYIQLKWNGGDDSKQNSKKISLYVCVVEGRERERAQ